MNSLIKEFSGQLPVNVARVEDLVAGVLDGMRRGDVNLHVNKRQHTSA